jgi:hypothetical protein
MGTRVDVFLSHDLARPDDPAETLGRLAFAERETFELRDLAWRKSPADRQPANRWELQPIHGRLPDLRLYYGPALQLMVMPKAAKIGTTYRWSQFLDDDAIRRVHLKAFRAIATSFGSAQIVICASTHDDITHRFMQGNYSQSDCIAALSRELGTPQASVDAIGAVIAALGPRESRRVWFLDRQTE